MTEGRTHATARWRRLDGPGDDTCRLVEAPGGWMLCGHARFTQEGVENRLDYVVRCNPRWETLGADVTGTRGGEEVAWRIVREAEGWVLGNGQNGGPAALPGCTDIDLAFTPATNLLPLRRLAFEGTEQVSAAWFRPEAGGSLSLLPQSYTPLGQGRYGYSSPNFEAELAVHPSGFVTSYPGLWEGSVDAG